MSDNAHPPAAQPPPPVAPPPAAPRGWGAGRIVAVMVSSLTLLMSFGLLAVGGSLLVAADVVRDDDGYVTSSTVDLQTEGYALVTDDLEIRNDSAIGDLPQRLIGTVKIEARADRGDVFVGIADSDDVAAYLAGVAYSSVVDPLDEGGDPTYEFTDGSAPPLLPEETDIWTASAAGAGTQEITFAPEEGDWTVVVMNADGSAPVESRVAAGATLPWLNEVAVGLLAGGLLLLSGGGIGLWLALRRS